MLNKNPIVSIVCHGNHLGRTVGMPTANFDAKYIHVHLPKDGVYASRVTLPDGKRKVGVTNIGNKPSINNQYIRNIETHILDFDGDLYGYELEVEVVNRIRDIKKFDSLEQVKAQVDKDIKVARVTVSI